MWCLKATAGWLMVDHSSHFEGPGKKLKNADKNILLRQRMGHEDWLNSSSQRERKSVPFREYVGPIGIVEGREMVTGIMKAWIEL